MVFREYWHKRYGSEFFKKLYSDEESAFTPFIIPANKFPRLNIEEMDQLSKPFMGSEIKRAIFDMNSFKAPGPDGYQALFFQKHWDTIGNQLIQLALDTLEGRELPERLNETFLVLIPKLDNPQCVTQLRPIGLCNVAYKAITKAIVNRLKPILAKLIFPKAVLYLGAKFLIIS